MSRTLNYFTDLSSNTATSLKCPNAGIVADSYSKATVFNDCFSASFTSDNHVFLSDINPPVSKCHISSILFPIFSVLGLFTKLKNSRTITPDGFSSQTIKILGASISYLLSRLFEIFFSHNYVPLEWKLSFITPIHKKGTRSDPKNFRPIANTSIICGLMERIIHEPLSLYLFQHNLLSPAQHGFQAGKSSTSNLLESVTGWLFFID